MLKKLIIVSVLLMLTANQANADNQPQTKKNQDATIPAKVEKAADSALEKITPDEESALQQRLQEEQQATASPFGISLYRPTYILPFYYTQKPDQSVYAGNTPDNQSIQKKEFKGQLSLKFPLFRNLFHRKIDLNIAYTQLSYWQFYAKSQFFRETNYEPEVFFSYNFYRNWLLNTGVVHESNGRGGDLERSWNRAYFDLSLSSEHWLISVKPWILIFKADSSDLHNPDIAKYLGHERILAAAKFYHQVVSLQLRNTFESGFKRGAVILTWSLPLKKHFSIYVQGFSGYGQSLIEYNHYTNSVGIGLALNDWI